MDPDPYVFGPPGSESVIICTDPDPPIIKQKKKKNNVFYCCDFFMTLKNDVNVLQKVKKNLEKFYFC